TLRYEKLEIPLRVKLLRIFGFLATALVTAIIIVSIAYKYFPSTNEKRLMEQNANLKDDYTVLQDKVKQLEMQMDELENRDNNVYRSIFEATPIPDSARITAMEKTKEANLIEKLSENDLIKSMNTQLNNLSLRTAFMEKSYVEISNMVKNKEKLLAAIPAIQPVSNKDLTRIASGFGYRIHPIYKVGKMHEGLDFTAPQGTPIYATANGTITEAGFNAGGFGNEVRINHGFGYETVYGHMVRIKAKQGQAIKRGEVIGYVGNTGRSTGPHCHYEVHKSGRPVDPIYYFYNDISPAQFDRLLKLASSSNQSFD
ncbi:MAG: M23 family metallopeptidase, partial [Deinococcales bacterium]|nr:M23 family metallopeptidase [Chitinophagaceae bacterium]